jgi:hypothetical protein
VRAAESNSATLLAELKGPSGKTVKSAFQRLSKSTSNNRKLVERLKAHYEGRKMEYTQLKTPAAAGEKYKKYWKHATIKAKGYRAHAEVLEKAGD